MKYFYTKDRFNFLSYVLSEEFVNAASSDYNNFLSNLSTLQQEKIDMANRSKYIKHFNVLIYCSKQTKKSDYNLFDVHCMDYNRFDGEDGNITPDRGIRGFLMDKEMSEINDRIDESANVSSVFFKETLTKITKLPVNPSVVGVMHFIKNTYLKIF